MTVVVDLPYCIQCGAAPEKRRQLNCSYCGAVLPWELWDELSKRRVKITAVEEDEIETALAQARRSASAGRSRSRARIRRMRKLRWRRSPRDRTQTMNHEDQSTMNLVILGLVVLGGLATLLQRQPVLGAFLVLGLCFAAWMFFRAFSARQNERKVRRRRAERRNGQARVAASVLAVSQPELTPGTDSHWMRVITLHVARGRQRVLLAKADVGVRAGDTGVASVLGNELVDFRVHQNVAG